MKSAAWLACLVALGACVAPESGNPAPRCNQSSECAPEQFCYRGFCVEDEQSVDPISEGDASTPALDERDAAVQPVADAGATHAFPGDQVPPRESDASAVVVADASAPPAPVVPDASAAPVDAAPAPAPDAGLLPCLNECKAPGQASPACKKCVKNAFGEEPDKLCGKPSDDDDDDDKVLGALHDPVCVALCLGVAITDPSCSGPLLFCASKKCGGKP